jgi:hypothetical protein
MVPDRCCGYDSQFIDGSIAAVLTELPHHVLNRLTFGFPAVVALSLDKGAYSIMRGSFSEKKVTAFLHGVTTGRQPTAKLNNFPTVVTTEPWDGKDSAPIEDEIPLSEIMGWDDDEGMEL